MNPSSALQGTLDPDYEHYWCLLLCFRGRQSNNWEGSLLLRLPHELRLDIWKHVLGRRVVHVRESTKELERLREYYRDTSPYYRCCSLVGCEAPLCVSRKTACDFQVSPHCPAFSSTEECPAHGCSSLCDAKSSRARFFARWIEYDGPVPRHIHPGWRREIRVCRKWYAESFGDPEGVQQDPQRRRPRGCFDPHCFCHFRAGLRLLRVCSVFKAELEPLLFATTLFSFAGATAFNCLIAVLSTRQRRLLRKIHLSLFDCHHIRPSKLRIDTICELVNVDALYLSLLWRIRCEEEADEWDESDAYVDRRLRNVLQWRVLPLKTVQVSFEEMEYLGLDKSAEIAERLEQQLLDPRGEQAHREDRQAWKEHWRPGEEKFAKLLKGGIPDDFSCSTSAFEESLADSDYDYQDEEDEEWILDWYDRDGGYMYRHEACGMC